ncbi:hypothetical protein J6590_009767 [Homalodisca vitripennis]|nr:hypothetical protein J6590_009767 [Homalodisca vitripennis]
MLQNVVWERADLGDRNSLNNIYRSFGLPHAFTIHTRPSGSTLHLLTASPLDKGLYRCIVSAVDTASPESPALTVFQDIEFLPHL